MIAQFVKSVIHGRVILNGEWVPIDIKLSFMKRRERLINEGYVEYKGNWMTIDQKIDMIKLDQQKDSTGIMQNPLDRRYNSR